MKKIMRTFNYYSDPSHGWLKVKKDLLIKLGISNQISTYSYQRGEWAYLEEDCDFSKLVDALALADIPCRIIHKHTNKSSKIRSYESYRF